MTRLRAALLAIMVVASAHAETVRVAVVNDGVTGEGWTYAENGTCYVVTPRHVVVRDGRVALPLLVNAAGIEGQGVEPALPPDTLRVDGEPMDAARFRVIGTLSTHCKDNLGYENLDATLARMRNAGLVPYISKVLPQGSEEIVAATIIEINKDGDRFTLRPVSSGDTIEEGDSGSPVRLRSDEAREQALPLGLVTESLGDGMALVLRMDAIRRWVAARSSVAAPGTAVPFQIIGWSAATPDPACGPANLLNPAVSCGWRAEVQPGTATVDLDLALASTMAAISDVRLTLEPGTHLLGMEILVSDESGWQSLRYCRAVQDATVQACGFLPRAASSIRIRLAKFSGTIHSIELH